MHQLSEIALIKLFTDLKSTPSEQLETEVRFPRFFAFQEVDFMLPVSRHAEYRSSPP
jgi:hypothetical protein